MLDEAVRREMRRDADMLRSTNRNGETSMSRVEAFERLFGHLPTLIDALEQAEAERDALKARVAEYEVHETHVSEIRARKNEALVQASLAAEAVRKLCAPERVASAAAYDLAADVLAELECIVRPHHTHYAPESNAPAPSPVTAATEAHGETTEAQEG